MKKYRKNKTIIDLKRGKRCDVPESEEKTFSQCCDVPMS